MSSETMQDTPRMTESARPLLFISHRHADRPIADALRKFVTDRSGGRIAVFQSSSAEAENPRVGRELQKELKEHLWAAGIVILVYTSPEEDWSYCMWECGVATHPQSPETKVVVLQCGSAAAGGLRRCRPGQRPGSGRAIQKFASEFLTSADFFPGRSRGGCSRIRLERRRGPAGGGSAALRSARARRDRIPRKARTGRPCRSCA